MSQTPPRDIADLIAEFERMLMLRPDLEDEIKRELDKLLALHREALRAKDPDGGPIGAS